jgi:hypothetical protein
MKGLHFGKLAGATDCNSVNPGLYAVSVSKWYRKAL